jgi:nucleoside-diphosphate-sugar epimerase
MLVLVIAGTGFIGSQVVRALQRMGHTVAVFHRGRTEAELPSSVTHFHGERDQLASFRSHFQRLGPEVVIDMRLMTERDAEGAVTAFRGIARRLVAISSGDVYRAYDVFRQSVSGPPKAVPITEDSPLRDTLFPYRGPERRRPDESCSNPDCCPSGVATSMRTCAGSVPRFRFVVIWATVVLLMRGL